MAEVATLSDTTRLITQVLNIIRSQDLNRIRSQVLNRIIILLDKFENPSIKFNFFFWFKTLNFFKQTQTHDRV